MRNTTATVLAFFCAASVQAQAPDTTRSVKGSVETVAAEVDVLVLDSKSLPVEGLTKSDFTLFVNGRETPLDYLEAPRARATAVAYSPGPPSTPPPPSSPRRAHSTVLIFDDLHTSLAARQKGITSLRSYLATLGEGEEVAVYGLNFGLRTLQPFTRDRTLVERALDRAGRTVPLSQIGFPTSEEYLSRSRQTFRSFADLFRALASRPEPKTVVLVAGSTPATGETNAGLRGATDAARFPPFAPEGVRVRGGPPPLRVPSTSYGYSFVDEERNMANEALLARATVIALDPTGLEPPGRGADSPGTESPGVDSPVAGSARIESFAYLNDTFALLADETGGARVGFSNAYGDRLIAESERLNLRYRLGFTPPDSSSDRRDIRVTVSRPGVTVRVASGQRSLTAEAASRARFSALLLRSDVARGDFPITVKFDGPVTKRKSDAFIFDILIPLAGVFSEDVADAKRAHLELLIAGVDPEGRVGNLMVLPFQVEIAKNAPGHGFFRHHGDFQLDRKWKGRLFLGIRDQATNQLGAATIPIGS